MRVHLGRTGHTDHAAPPTPRNQPGAYDLIDAPAGAGHRVLLRLERLGAPLGPALLGPTGRLQFFVQAGSTATFAADLASLGWTAAALDLRAVSTTTTAATPLPPPTSPRWLRPPDPEPAAGYPPARLLLGSLVYACRHPRTGASAVPTQAGQRKAA
jgi:hypothetical protein